MSRGTIIPSAQRILIVDDNLQIHEDFRKILTRGQAPSSADRLADIDMLEAAILGVTTSTLKDHSVEVSFAQRGQDALKMVTAAVDELRPYSMAFVDMRMPNGWDGVETIENLWKKDPHLQVVICTAYSDHSWDEIESRLGGSDQLLILKKPFDDIEIMQLARSLSRKRAAETELLEKAFELEQQVAIGKQLGREVKLLMESTGIGIYGVDRAGRCTFINHAGACLLGYSREKLQGRNMHEMVQHHRADGTPYAFAESKIQAIQESEVSCRVESEVFWDQQGKAISVEYHAFPMRSGGEVIGTVVTFSNITERLRLTEELMDAKNIAEAANQAKSLVLAELGEDLGLPLHSAIEKLELLKQTVLDDTQKEYLRLAKNAAETIEQLNKEIVEFSVLDARAIETRTRR